MTNYELGIEDAGPKPRRCFRIMLGCAMTLCVAVPSLRADESQPAPAEPLTAEQAIIQQAREVADKFVVRIETVGGVQPLNRLPGASPSEDDEQTPSRNPNLFRDNPGSSFKLADGPTTGIIYSADGLILSSSFNFVRQPSIVTVTLPDKRQLPAKILGRDHVRKLTLLKVNAADLPTPEWAPREEIRVGQWAIALGRGFGGDQSMVSAGIVSALNRMAGNAIQTDAKLSPANYGGPLLDSYGRVLGVCVPMAQRPGELAGIEFYDSGIGFAVPGWRVREIAEQLAAGHSFNRGWLGMQADPHRQDAVVILRMADPSPIRDAGAQSGDQIVEVNGETIEHFGHLIKALNMLPAGEKVRLKLLRGADFLDVELVLADAEELGNLPPVEEPFDPSMPTGPDQSEEPPD